MRRPCFLLSIVIVLILLASVVRSGRKCTRKKGRCQNEKRSSCDGHYVDGLCGGRRSVKCCVPGQLPDESIRRKCLKIGGVCADQRKTTCNGRVESGHCGGDDNVQCCVPLAKQHTAGFSDQCLGCICKVEGCQRNVGRCRRDIYSDSCGPFQIKEPYWDDCHQPGSDWRDCTKTMKCSTTCVRSYVQYYGDRCASVQRKGPATCQHYARVHNGGPRGCRDRDTLGYWRKIQACCIEAGGC